MLVEGRSVTCTLAPLFPQLVKPAIWARLRLAIQTQNTTMSPIRIPQVMIVGQMLDAVDDVVPSDVVLD